MIAALFEVNALHYCCALLNQCVAENGDFLKFPKRNIFIIMCLKACLFGLYSNRVVMYQN